MLNRFVAVAAFLAVSSAAAADAQPTVRVAVGPAFGSAVGDACESFCDSLGLGVTASYHPVERFGVYAAARHSRSSSDSISPSIVSGDYSARWYAVGFGGVYHPRGVGERVSPYVSGGLARQGVPRIWAEYEFESYSFSAADLGAEPVWSAGLEGGVDLVFDGPVGLRFGGGVARGIGDLDGPGTSVGLSGAVTFTF